MSKTGHASFDRWKDEFSATVRDIEAAMHERAISSSSSSSSSGTPAITDNDDNKDNATELIRRASTILAKLSSEAGKVSEREEPALKQELLDIYKACRMQIKTYKSLNKQRELFDDPSGGATTTRTKQTPMTKPATKPSVSEQRSSLFGSSAGTTPRNNNNNNNNGGRWGSDAGGVRERVASTTQGRVRNQNSRLEDALRSIRESEQVAMEITGELEGQRESLETTRGRLGQFASMTEYSKGLLNSMNKPWWRKW